MKKLLPFLSALCAFVLATPLLTLSGGCAAPSARVAQVQSLKAVGQSAESAVELSAQLYRDGRITPAQARQVADFYDQRFQPSFRLAVAAVNANLDSIASPDVAALASQLSALVVSFQNQAP